MNTIGIDIETFSSIDLKKSGIYRYVESPDFEVLIIAYSINREEPKILNKTIEEEEWFRSILIDPNYIKTAWNVQFEIACLSKYVNIKLDKSQWECTMVKASMISYPMSLDLCAKAMKLEVQKSATGKALIKYFSVPCKPTISNGGRTRNLPNHDPQKWNSFKEYCIFDVKVEQSILEAISFVKFSSKEKSIWLLDQKINEKGVKVDIELASKALKLDKITRSKLIEEAIKLTGLNNPNSISQLKKWLEEIGEEDIENLNKENIKELIKENDNPTMLRVLNIRQELSKTSIKKYNSILACFGEENRVRGMLQYNGASKTGRWTARLVQLHNLPKNKISNLDLARNLVKEENLEDIELLFGNTSNVLSELIRTTFIPAENKIFLPSDFSAIEARVLAWFAGEDWRLKVFRGDGKIYEASGAKMFKVPIENVIGDIRFKSKTAELALGFQGGVGAIDRMEAMGLKTGLKQEEKQPLVNLWRKENPNIVKFWYAVENAAIAAIEDPGIVQNIKYLKFIVRNNILYIILPSGRYIAYIKPTLKENSFGKLSIHYQGQDQITRQWRTQNTYGGKLVENIVQGTSRDILADAMLRLDNEGFDIAMHVHDEIVLEVDIDESPKLLKKTGEIMDQDIPWVPGLPLAAVSFLTPYYKKE